MGICISQKFKPETFLDKDLNVDMQIEPINKLTKQVAEELIDTISWAFAGDPQHEPELTWQNMFANHPEWGSKLRKNLFDYYAAFYVYYTYNYGVMYAFRDKETKVMKAAACLFPPNAYKNGQVYTTFKVIKSILPIGKPPEQIQPKVYDGDLITKRIEDFDKILDTNHKKYASGTHWYLLTLAVKPKYQNQGYGKTLMQFINKLADRDKVDCYLECTGQKNIDMFTKQGYKIMGSQHFQYNKQDETTKSPYPCTFMLRNPK